jgi:hypothetical protein
MQLVAGNNVHVAACVRSSKDNSRVYYILWAHTRVLHGPLHKVFKTEAQHNLMREQSAL